MSVPGPRDVSLRSLVAPRLLNDGKFGGRRRAVVAVTRRLGAAPEAGEPGSPSRRAVVDDLLHHVSVRVRARIRRDPDQIDAAVREGREVLAEHEVEDDARTDERTNESYAL
ncbi:MAG: hypothetical protein ABI990_08060, partial [Actinomycetota bacterium]